MLQENVDKNSSCSIKNFSNYSPYGKKILDQIIGCLYLVYIDDISYDREIIWCISEM